VLAALGVEMLPRVLDHRDGPLLGGLEVEQRLERQGDREAVHAGSWGSGGVASSFASSPGPLDSSC
jgi:hypothetical protein